MILLVVNVGSLQTRSNQLKYQEQKSRSPKIITTKLITGFQLFLSLYWQLQQMEDVAIMNVPLSLLNGINFFATFSIYIIFNSCHKFSNIC